MRHQLLSLAMSTGAGAIAGALVAFAMGAFDEGSPAPTADEGGVTMAVHPRGWAPNREQEAQRMAPGWQEHGGGGGPPPAASPHAEAVPPIDPLVEETEEDRALSRALAEEQFAEEVSAHAREERDPAWATGMEESLTAHFDRALASALTEAGGALIDIDCRSSTCAVVTEWPSYGAALGTYAQLVHDSWSGVGCSREMMLPDSDPPSGPFEVTMLMKCIR